MSRSPPEAMLTPSAVGTSSRRTTSTLGRSSSRRASTRSSSSRARPSRPDVYHLQKRGRVVPAPRELVQVLLTPCYAPRGSRSRPATSPRSDEEVHTAVGDAERRPLRRAHGPGRRPGAAPGRVNRPGSSMPSERSCFPTLSRQLPIPSRRGGEGDLAFYWIRCIPPAVLYLCS